MRRPIFVACLITACITASGAGAAAAYRVEHAYIGNSDARNDRLYVRDSKTGKRKVLSRHWGAKCKRAAALSYRLEGGCWYPVRESGSGWRRQAEGWLRLDLGRSLRDVWVGRHAFRAGKRKQASARIGKTHRQ